MRPLRIIGSYLFLFEDALLRTPIPHAREALARLGAPLLAETYGTTQPRRGVMPI